MDTLSLHSSWGLTTMIMIALAIVGSIIGLKSDKDLTIMQRKFSLYALITVHIQVILGFISYTQSPHTVTAMSNFGAAMKDSLLRLFAVEHPLMMIIGAVLITIGYTKAKKAVDVKVKYKKVLIYYSIGLLLILSRIPWAQWEIVSS